jgi:hypothetical protein
VGRVFGDTGQIITSSNTGAVTGFEYVGGLLGEGRVEIGACYNTGAVTANISNRCNDSSTSHVGGLVGQLERKRSTFRRIYGSYNTGAVTGFEHVGGMVGYIFHDYYAGNSLDELFINYSYNTGAVTGTSHVGGVVGYSGRLPVRINYSYNSGPVTGSYQVGGLVGNAEDGGDSYCGISGSYNTGAVTGNSGVGGLAGIGKLTIIASYNTGAVTGSSGVGGLAGDCMGITDSYWLYNPATDASTGIGTGSDDGCARFGDGSWPASNFSNWMVGASGYGAYPYWKTLGAWAGGGTPDGVNSTFPKLYWEED